MKTFNITGLVASVAFTMTSFAAEQGLLKTDMEKSSYALGMQLAETYDVYQIEINPNALATGFRDVIERRKPALGPDQQSEALKALRSEQDKKTGGRRIGPFSWAEQRSKRKAQREKEQKQRELTNTVTTAADLSAPTLGSELKNETDKMSYALGAYTARKYQTNDISPEAIALGFTALLSGNALLNDKEATEARTALERRVAQRRSEARKLEEAKLKEQRQKVEKEGEAFLADNKNKSGIVSLPSGVQYKVHIAGTGPKPGSNDTVIVLYRGRKIDGTEFVNSTKRGEPGIFAMKGLSKGWSEALLMMPVGSKWEVFIPGPLAAAPFPGRGGGLFSLGQLNPATGQTEFTGRVTQIDPDERRFSDRFETWNIEPGATLIFEINLVDIKR